MALGLKAHRFWEKAQRRGGCTVRAATASHKAEQVLGSRRPYLVPSCHLATQLRAKVAMLDSSRKLGAFTVRHCGMCAPCIGSLRRSVVPTSACIMWASDVALLVAVCDVGLAVMCERFGMTVRVYSAVGVWNAADAFGTVTRGVRLTTCCTLEHPLTLWVVATTPGSSDLETVVSLKGELRRSRTAMFGYCILAGYLCMSFYPPPPPTPLLSLLRLEPCGGPGLQLDEPRQSLQGHNSSHGGLWSSWIWSSGNPTAPILLDSQTKWS